MNSHLELLLVHSWRMERNKTWDLTYSVVKFQEEHIPSLICNVHITNNSRHHAWKRGLIFLDLIPETLLTYSLNILVS